jgi:DNA repair exonuclease SbcCD ATPase subunit
MSLLAKGRIDQTRLDITEVKTKIESVTASIRSWELLIEESESASDEEINSVVAQIELAKDEIIKIEVSIAKHEHELDNLNEDISRIPASAEDLSNKHSKIISKVSEIETQASTMNKAIKFVQQHDDCPTCKQVITSEHKCQIIEENTSGIASLQSSHKKNKDNLKIVKDLMKQMSDMVSQVSEISNKVRMEKSSISNKQSLIGSYNDRIKSLCEKKSAEISYDNLNRLKGEIGAHNQSYDHLSARQNVLRDAQGLLKDSGIKAVIISKYIPRLNTIINNYLEKLDFFCSFHINEEFNETIKSRHRDIFSYSSFSEGEKMRINISIMLALRDIARARNSATCNLLILDEVGDSSLDEAGTEEFLQIIKNLTEGQNNVFIISHKMGTQDGTFDRIIRAEKQGNFSAYTQIA